MKELVFQYVLPPILTAIGLGAAWALTTLGAWAQARWKDSKIGTAIDRVSNFAAAIVRELEVTMRPEIVKAVGDGKLSPAEANHLKQTALNKLKTMLGDRGLKELSGVVGVFAPSVDEYLSGVLEKKVAELHRKPAIVAFP